MSDETTGATGAALKVTTILVCQCGHTQFEIKKRTKTSVSLACDQCGGKLSVKGSLATPVRAPAGEVAVAISKNRVDPDPGAQTKSSSPTLSEQGYRTLRFRVSDGEYEVIRRGMETVRVLNCKDDKYRNQQWQGAALEFMSADFMAGADPRALQVVSQMEDAITEEQARYLERTGQTNLTKRRIRTIRNAVRDRVAEQLGLVGSDKYVPPPDQTAAGRAEYEEAKKLQRQEEDADERLADDGRLFQAVVQAMTDYRRQLNDELDQDVELLIGKGHQRADVEHRWISGGGNLFKVLGDSATKDGAGQRPEVYLWMEGTVDEATPDLDLAYTEKWEDVLDDVELEVVELVPSDYDELDDQDKWDLPPIARRREAVR